MHAGRSDWPARRANFYGYGDGNPLSNIDPKGLAPIGGINTSCTCMNCPSGFWYQYGGTLSGMFKSVGGGASLYRFRCLSGRMQCDYLTVCGKGGVGLFGGLVGGGGITLFAYCPEELDGWSWNVDFDVPDGSGNAGPGSSGTFSATVEVGTFSLPVVEIKLVNARFLSVQSKVAAWVPKDIGCDTFVRVMPASVGISDWT